MSSDTFWELLETYPHFIAKLNLLQQAQQHDNLEEIFIFHRNLLESFFSLLCKNMEYVHEVRILKRSINDL